MISFRSVGIFVTTMAVMLAVAGCGGKPQQQGGPLPVNAYKISSSQASIPVSFTGTVSAENSVQIRARVSGHIIEKYVKGGEHVTKGQPLFKIDSRQYQANLASAEATAARANAAYQNAERDLQRYQELAKDEAIAQQTVDRQMSMAAQDRAAYEANEAAVQIARDNVQDTIVYAPFDGTLEMDAVDLGTFVQAGVTPLVTINSSDPAVVQFSMSEAEYLHFMKDKNLKSMETDNHLKLILADGSTYPYDGVIVQSAKNLDSGSGQLILKATFPNPNHVLIPNMYASVVSPGDVIKNALLVPSRAIIQVLDKQFVMVIGNDGKVVQTPITTAGTQGIFTIVNGGLKPGATIVVDGLTKVKNGMPVHPTMLTKEQIEQGK